MKTSKKFRLDIVVMGEDGERIVIAAGRTAWALDNLIKAGATGCTPIDCPAPRWSSYVHKLRRKHLLNIETVDEPHGGPYAGFHARYVLRDRVRIITRPNDTDPLDG